MSEIPAPALADDVVLLDGGMGQELFHRGVRGPKSIWSAYALFAAPEAVVAVHKDFIRAGARIITTNSYSATRRRLSEAGIGDRFGYLNRTAGELARRARDESGADVLIAGSLPPLGGTYRPDLAGRFDEMESLYREQAEILAPYVDMFLCETMSASIEAQAAVAGAATTGKPIWVAWSLADRGVPQLRSGETVASAVATMSALPVSGFLLNCCAPESVTAAMPELAAMGFDRIGGYANAYVGIPHKWEAKSGPLTLRVRDDLDPDAYAAHAQSWIDAGASVVGGCCEIGPAHIARLRELLH